MSVLSTGSFLALAMQCAPDIHPDTSHDIARVESGFNPYAIAEIIPKSERKPGKKEFITHLPVNKKEALNIVRDIQKKGRRFSVGLMQITSTNFKTLGVTADELFSPCNNLTAFEKIMIDCWERGRTMERALSCYYTGNFTSGLKSESTLNNTSYVQRVGYAPADKKYIVPGTKNEPRSALKDESLPPSFESWDVLREYPRTPSVESPSLLQSEKPKEVINEQAASAV